MIQVLFGWGGDHLQMFQVGKKQYNSPVEYWSEDNPEEPERSGLTEVNRKLAALGREAE